MNLHELAPVAGSVQTGKRKGRGHGTGYLLQATEEQ